MPNIITAVFGGFRFCTTRSVFQIDKGDVLRFVGLDLPEYYEVHFSNSKNAPAKRVLASGDSVVIPWEYMKHGQKEVYAWVYLTPDAETGYTPYQVTIPLNLRSDISESQPTPPQEDIVNEAIAALNEGVKRAEDAADNAEEATRHYPRIVNGYWQVWDAETQTWSDTGIKAVGEDGAPGRDGAPGQPGRDGQDGSPGVTYTPTVSADGEISWTNDGGLPNPQPRNITGAQGQDGAPGQPGRDGATGPAGKSAYESAQDGGYSGTEAQFETDLAGVGNKQDKVLASGLLKGDGAGGVSAATPGTDYVPPSDYAPDSKTAAMTQPVGRDASGKLWTAPGGGGGVPIDLGITGASVGQFAKVKTVDAIGKPTAWETESIKYTLTVTAQTQDGVTVTGQTVTVREGGADGQVFATATYDGQPVSFAVPVGFVYYVSVSDDLASHFNPTTATGIVTNTNIAVTLTYSDFGNIRTAADIQAALNAEIDLTGLVGEQISCVKGSGSLTWDVVDYDNELGEVTLLLHDTLPTQLQFEPEQALAYFEHGLPAGDYKFKTGNTYYYLTLTKAIPDGGQLNANTSSFRTYESQSATIMLEVGTVSATEISGSTDLGTAGAGDLNRMERVNNGSSNYGEAGLRQWLNSYAPALTPMPRINKFSRAYVVAEPGFLSDLDPDFVACLADTEWKCSANVSYEAPASMGGIVVKGNPYTVTDKIGLASEMEIFGSYNGVLDGSHIFDLYVGATADDRKKYYNNTARDWWLRSPREGSPYSERIVRTSGTANYLYATVSLGIVPACKIKKSV